MIGAVVAAVPLLFEAEDEIDAEPTADPLAVVMVAVLLSAKT